jgi:hypothetical protein
MQDGRGQSKEETPVAEIIQETVELFKQSHVVVLVQT